VVSKFCGLNATRRFLVQKYRSVCVAFAAHSRHWFRRDRMIHFLAVMGGGGPFLIGTFASRRARRSSCCVLGGGRGNCLGEVGGAPSDVLRKESSSVWGRHLGRFPRVPFSALGRSAWLSVEFEALSARAARAGRIGRGALRARH